MTPPCVVRDTKRTGSAMNNVLDDLRQLSVVPSCEGSAYDAWLEQDDAMAFLAKNAGDDEIVIYASSRHTYIHGVLIPKNTVDPPDIDDLLRGGENPYSSLRGSSSKTIAQGDQLVFGRNFTGVPEYEQYIEISQKFVHALDIHICRNGTLGADGTSTVTSGRSSG